MSCPLCNAKSSVISRRSALTELRECWSSAFGFDPFPGDFQAGYIEKRKCTICQLEYFHPPYYGDAEFYARISKHPWYYERDKWEYDVAAEIVSRLPSKDLLEIGCGNGYFLDKIASLDLEVEGIDINNDAVAACTAKGLKVDAADVFTMTESYDTVVLFEVLEHMENAKELFEFLTTRLLRPGGHLIIAVPNPEGYLKEVGLNLLDMPPHHNSCWRLSTFEHLHAQFGLELVEYKKEPIRYVHYLGLLQSIVGENAKLAATTWKTKIFNRVQSQIVRLFAPFTYLRDRERIEGQTHLVVLKNVR